MSWNKLLQFLRKLLLWLLLRKLLLWLLLGNKLLWLLWGELLLYSALFVNLFLQ